MKELITAERAPAMPQRNSIPEAAVKTEKAPLCLPEWKVAGIFSSHMVLQRERPITIWGWSRHIGAVVTGVWGEETVSAAVDETGRFELVFQPRAASFAPSRMTVASAYGSDTFEDVLSGDVWVVGGQSNAELALEPCLGDTPEIAQTLREDHPFRLFTQTQAYAVECKQFYHEPARDVINPEWRWQRPGPEAAKSFSAIGYYFARLLTEHVPVPVGVVMMCAGGACLRELMPLELAHERGYTEGANMPVGGYYNTLIAPLLGLQFKGQLFFQGESEGIWTEMALAYDGDLAAFVADERQRFGFNFSFYNVQLSSYREECDAHFQHLYWVRSRQLMALEQIPNSYLAVSRDLGSRPEDADFAHSPHKYPLAQRLAALALAGDYGVGGLEAAYSPLPLSAVRRGGEAVVTFRCVNGGLSTLDAAPPAGFSVLDAAGAQIPAQARITASDTVCVQLPEGMDIAEVHFAMTNMAYAAQGNLCGGSGLPAPAFVLPLQNG